MKALLKNSGPRPVRPVGRNGCFDDTASGTGILPAILGCAGIWPYEFPRLGRRVAALPHDNVTRGRADAAGPEMKMLSADEDAQCF
jgi:hypothetical protein